MVYVKMIHNGKRMPTCAGVVSGPMVFQSYQLPQQNWLLLQNHNHQDNVDVEKMQRKKSRKERGTNIYYIDSPIK